jgi:hypothetical protein
MVQIPETVDPEILFRQYVYTPSASTTWKAHCSTLSEWIRRRVAGDSTTFVVEPASNDGCLLARIGTWTERILGVEPARNIAEQANADGIPTMPEFFGVETARSIRETYGAADVVVGTNVLAHVPDILDFLHGAALLLREHGSLVIEAPYLRDLVDRLAYDTVYHEHVSYFSVTALRHAFELAGLELVHVERAEIHGGSIRFVGMRQPATPDASVQRFLQEEEGLGYTDGTALSEFAGRVEQLRARLPDVLHDAHAEGKTIAAYGATAKGNTLLTTCGLDRTMIRYVVDRNPRKQGLLTPGSAIPVVPPVRIDEERVDILLLLAWNLESEILAEQHRFREAGGRFLIPLPEPRFA